MADLEVLERAKAQFDGLNPGESYMLRYRPKTIPGVTDDSIEGALITAYGGDAPDHYDEWSQTGGELKGKGLALFVIEKRTNEDDPVKEMTLCAPVSEACAPYYSTLYRRSNHHGSEIPGSIIGRQAIYADVGFTARLVEPQAAVDAPRVWRHMSGDWWHSATSISLHEVELEPIGDREVFGGSRASIDHLDEIASIREEASVRPSVEYPITTVTRPDQITNLTPEYGFGVLRIAQSIIDCLDAGKRPRSHGAKNAESRARYDNLPSMPGKFQELKDACYGDFTSSHSPVMGRVDFEDLMMNLDELARFLVLRKRFRRA